MGRTNDIICFRVKESGADTSLSQGTMASTFFTEQDAKSGFSPSIPPFGVAGQDLREGPVDGDGGNGVWLMLPDLHSFCLN